MELGYLHLYQRDKTPSEVVYQMDCRFIYSHQDTVEELLFVLFVFAQFPDLGDQLLSLVRYSLAFCDLSEQVDVCHREVDVDLRYQNHRVCTGLSYLVNFLVLH